MNHGMEPQKQMVFIAKSTKNQSLLTNSGVITSIVGVSGIELHSSITEPVNFKGGTILAWGGTILVWRGTSSDLGGGTASDCSPWRQAWRLSVAIYRL